MDKFGVPQGRPGYVNKPLMLHGEWVHCQVRGVVAFALLGRLTVLELADRIIMVDETPGKIPDLRTTAQACRCKSSSRHFHLAGA